MKHKALLGLMGVVLVGMTAVAWGMRDGLSTRQATGYGNETADLRTLGLQRQVMEDQHVRIMNRAEGKRKLIQGFLAGQIATEVLIDEIEAMNRASGRCLPLLAQHYPDATEREIAIWHAVGLVEGELEFFRASLQVRFEADVWLRETGLVPSLAW